MKKIISICLAVIMCFSVMTTAISVSAKETKTVSSSAIGDIQWYISAGYLYLIGSGDMPNYDAYNTAPWSNKSQEINTVVIDENITSIGSYAFYNLSNLTYVMFSGTSKLTKVGEKAFSYCTSLSYITLPSTVKSVGKCAFYNCKSLTSFSTNCSASYGEYAFEECTNLKTVNAPKSKSFAGYAFYFCDNLTQANLGNATLLSYSIYSNKKLTSLTAGSLQKYALYNLISLKSLNIKNAKYIQGYALHNLTSLTSVSSNATSVGEYAFYGSDNIKTINLPKVKSIPKYLFFKAKKLQTVKLGSVQSIGKYAFAGCTNLTTITGTSRVKRINDCAFNNCVKLKKFVTSNKLNYIGYQSFFNCRNLTGSINFLNVTCVNDEAFANCKNLTSTLNFRKVTTIGSNSFFNCQKVKGNTLGTKLKKLGSKAFLGCKSINTLYVPPTCKNLGYDIFVKNIKSIKYSNDFLYYTYSEKGKKITIFGNKGSQAQYYASLYKNPFRYAVKSVVIKKSAYTIKRGKTLRLSVFLTPKNCAKRTVIVKSSNNKIVSVSKNGTMKGVKKGKCKVTFTANDGSLKSKTITVTVK